VQLQYRHCLLSLRAIHRRLVCFPMSLEIPLMRLFDALISEEVTAWRAGLFLCSLSVPLWGLFDQDCQDQQHLVSIRGGSRWCLSSIHALYSSASSCA
jgi:hypothetical protein